MGSEHAKQNKLKGTKRSIYTGKIINGRDAILCDEAIDYVKSLGYKFIVGWKDDIITHEEFKNLKKQELVC